MQVPVEIYSRSPYKSSNNRVVSQDITCIRDKTFADISKAFDTVWVKALLYKLGNYGIKGDLLCQLNSYLSNRTQRVMIKDALSRIGHLHAGVPQGSVLGHLMFLIFINDITDEIVGLGRLFCRWHVYWTYSTR